MLTFSEYLQEMRMLKRLKEDMVASAGEAAANGSGEVVSPSNANSSSSEADVVASHSAVPTSDCSVLGRPKDCKGFLGKNDFFIPKNVLSGDYTGKPKVLKRF